MQGRSIDTDSVEEVECPRGREWVGDRKRKKGRGREKKEREGKDSEKNRERRKERGKGSVTNRERKKERKGGKSRGVGEGAQRYPFHQCCYLPTIQILATRDLRYIALTTFQPMYGLKTITVLLDMRL